MVLGQPSFQPLSLSLLLRRTAGGVRGCVRVPLFTPCCSILVNVHAPTGLVSCLRRRVARLSSRQDVVCTTVTLPSTDTQALKGVFIEFVERWQCSAYHTWSQCFLAFSSDSRVFNLDDREPLHHSSRGAVNWISCASACSMRREVLSCTK